MKKLLPIVVVVALAVSVGYTIGRFEVRFRFNNYKPAIITNKEVVIKSGKPATVDFAKFWTVWDKVSTGYVDKMALDSNKMVDGAIAGMVASLGDPYTVYLTSEQNKAEKDSLGGEFEGVGIQLGYKEKKLIVVAPLDGTPAKLAGVRAGDMILRIVDAGKNLDRDTEGITLPEAVSLIRGKKGTLVALTLAREAVTEPIKVELKRDTILVKSVEVEMLGDVAWVRVSKFGDRTQVEWDKSIDEYNVQCPMTNVQSKKCRGIVLDLRNNPGGYLEGSVYLTSEFLQKGKIVVKQQFGDGTSYENKVTRDGRLIKVPLVVLINEGSASAAEIMAGALGDSKRGK